MALAAKKLGWEYFGIGDHSQSLKIANGLSPATVRKQWKEIDALNERLHGIHIIKGTEVDILEDGSLDLPDEVLGKLDLVVGAIHSRFELTRARQTERILRAMDRPHFSIFAHPSGRLIDQREPYDVDMPRVIRKAKSRGCFLELNAQPDRMDLSDVYCQAAKAAGVLISIGSDSHSTTDFDFLRFGVGQARRGWLEKGDVLNTRSLKELRALLPRTM
jgi:DNA polymerase (family 10)